MEGRYQGRRGFQFVERERRLWSVGVIEKPVIESLVPKEGVYEE